MDERNLEKLVERDEALDTGNDQDNDTEPGLELLHRVRRNWDVWPGDDAALEVPADPRRATSDLLWGSLAAPPKSLGRFEVKRELGRGGFGIVLLAHDPKLQRDVALKIPRAECFLSAEARERMAREARAATILAHPAIVPVYEVGELGSVAYISYGHCDGESLAEWLDEQETPVTPKLAAAIAARLAEAIQHAHSRQIVHRDLKPSNVLLDWNSGETHDQPAIVDAWAVDDRSDHALDEPGTGVPRRTVEAFIDALRIADFGLAKLETARSDITRIGTPLGTPAYMSPEQARGEPDVGPASDIFSLGVMLYELLIGHVPFRRDSDVATLRAIESDVHPDIPVSSAPKDLAAICDKCLQKKASDRYETAQALQDDLQRFLNDEPVSARPVNRAVRFARWCQRNRALAAAIGLAAVFMVIGTAASTALGIRAEHKAEEAAWYARHSSHAVQSLLTALANEPSVQSAPMEEFRTKLHAAALEYYQAVRNERPDDLEQIRELYKTLSSLAQLQGMLGHLEEGAQMYAEAAALTHSLPSGAEARRAFAQAKRNQSRLASSDEAVAIAEAGVAALNPESSDEKELNALMLGLTEIAVALKRQAGEEHRADERINAALVAGARLVGREPLEWADAPYDSTYIALATTLRTKAEVAYACQQLEELPAIASVAIRMFEQIRDREPVHTPMCLTSLSSMYYLLANRHLDLKDWEQAEHLFRKRLEIDDALIELKPNLGFIRSMRLNGAYHLAMVLDKQDRDEDAAALVDSLLADALAWQAKFPEVRRQLQINEIDLRISRSNLYLEAEDKEGGVAELQRALELCDDLAGDGPRLPDIDFRWQNIVEGLDKLRAQSD